MQTIAFTSKEKEDIQKYFGKNLSELTPEDFKKIWRDLRAKFHPDNFEQFGNEAVREMATERFQIIEILGQKLRAFFDKTPMVAASGDGKEYMRNDAVFAAKRLKIEIITPDKDLKYHLFGTQYRWLELGDSFKIPSTKASIVIDDHYQGRRIGFQESVRMYLTFGEEDAIEDILGWLFEKIQGRATSLLVAGDSVKVDLEDIMRAVRKESYLRLETGV